jgi:hypothetical protein
LTILIDCDKTVMTETNQDTASEKMKKFLKDSIELASTSSTVIGHVGPPLEDISEIGPPIESENEFIGLSPPLNRQPTKDECDDLSKPLRAHLDRQLTLVDDELNDDGSRVLSLSEEINIETSPRMGFTRQLTLVEDDLDEDVQHEEPIRDHCSNEDNAKRSVVSDNEDNNEFLTKKQRTEA